MAGRERAGAVAGRHDLFDGRAWVLTPTDETLPEVVTLVAAVAEAAGAAVRRLPPEEHDRAVAAVSHVPQLAASLVAARLEGLDEDAVALAGQGLRDVTRIAASDPNLWTQILAGNAAAVRDVLAGLSTDLAAVVGGPRRPRGRRGRAGRSRDHRDDHRRRQRRARPHPRASTGRHRPPTTTVRVLVPDEPGQLGRLFADVGEIGTNIEEFHLDHGLGQPFGLAEVDVVPAAAAGLAEALRRPGVADPRLSPATTLARHDRTADHRHRRSVRLREEQRRQGGGTPARRSATSTPVRCTARSPGGAWSGGSTSPTPPRSPSGTRPSRSRSGPIPTAPTVTVGGTDVTEAIRTTEVSTAVSAVATNLEVRPVLQQLQRDLMARIADETGGVVAEGRDITTVVAPDARVRLLLTASRGGAPASPEHRAARDRGRAGRRGDPGPGGAAGP